MKKFNTILIITSLATILIGCSDNNFEEIEQRIENTEMTDGGGDNGSHGGSGGSGGSVGG